MINRMAGGEFYEQVFVARQPVFTRDKGLYGYELLFRGSADSAGAVFPDEDMASSKVFVDGLSLACSGVAENIRFFFNFSRQMLLNESALALSSERCVIEILENVPPDESVLSACLDLREQGYCLALDDYAGEPEREPFLPLVDMVKVDVRAVNRSHWARLFEKLHEYGATVVAEKVETWGDFRELHSLGYELFQGFFFSRPELIPGRKLPSGMLAKVQLLKVLGDPKSPLEEIPAIVAGDPGLSLRLLKFINSAAFGFRSHILSIGHASALMGLEPLRRWAMVVGLCDIDDSVRGQELTYLSLQRARFLELLAQEIPNPPMASEALFLLGLFSRLDAMLGMSMDEVLAGVALDSQLTEALLGADCTLGRWLQMLDALERGDGQRAATMVNAWGVESSVAAHCYMGASAWASEKVWTYRTHS